MEEEKRKSIRIKKPLVALYSYGNDKNNKKIWDQTQIRDISENGMLITTIKPFQTKDTLTLLIKLPTDPFQWIEFCGRVVDSKELKTVFDDAVAGTHITRIEFLELGESQKELIRKYIAWFLTKKRR